MMSNAKAQDIKDGHSSLGKDARQKRLALIREKKSKRFKENEG